ncbi:hypothetical protein HWV62_39660 [Athelia sp. TMB]|nr:hypothetical protein HWV62_39660 [Athelia sp. TMB]
MLAVSSNLSALLADNLHFLESNSLEVLALKMKMIFSNIPRTSKKDGLRLILALLVVALCFIARSLLHARKPGLRTPNSDHETRKALEALLTVLHPRNSRWPPSYISFARAAVVSRSKTIRIPLLKLVEDLLAGTIEFRDIGALGEIMAGKRVYGWRFDLCPTSQEQQMTNEAKDVWARKWTKVISASTLYESKLVDGCFPMRDSSAISASGSIFPPTTECKASVKNPITPTILLTGLPLRRLVDLIYFEGLVLPHGARLALEFSTCVPNSTMNDPENLLSAIPNLLRSSSGSNTGNVYSKNQLENALEATNLTLAHLVASLPPFEIESVRNVSQERAQELKTSLVVLGQKKALYGGREWRRRRLADQWEAGLFDARKVDAWVVVVRKP